MNLNFEKKKIDTLCKELETFAPEVFICFASFESRCKTIAEIVSASIKKAIICCYEPIIEEAKINKESLHSLFDKIYEVPFTREEPFKGIDKLLSFLKKTEKLPRILVDITTFSRESLLTFIAAINALHKNDIDKIRFIYNPASEYDSGKEVSEKRLSYGIKEIRSILGYPGSLIPTKSVHLIIMVGFEIERVIHIIEKYEPSKITLGMGRLKDSMSDEIYESNKNIGERLIKSLEVEYPVIETFEFAGNNPFKAKEELIEIINKNKDYNNVIMPMNTKISSIGVALACLDDKAVQIAYAEPESYNYKNYSVPSDNYYLFSLQF